MHDLRSGPRFLKKPPQDLRARRVLRVQELERDVAIEPRVARDEHETEATLAELPAELVLPDHHARAERHDPRRPGYRGNSRYNNTVRRSLIFVVLVACG